MLVLGYGNPGRKDDGLGPAFAEAAAALDRPGIVAESLYQLGVENAADAARHEVVLFADAAVAGPEPYGVTPVEPDARVPFTTHAVSPGAVLHLARELYGSAVRGLLLGIRGYDFDEFGEGLSPGARTNLDRALAALESGELDHE